MGFLSGIVKELDNEYAGMAIDGTAGDLCDFIDTGSYMLNALLSGSIWGGIPGNRITGLAGEEATGKTFYQLSIVKSFLNKDPKAEAAIFDTEAAISKEMLIERGLDPKRVLIVSVITVQEFRTQLLKLLNAYEKVPEGSRTPLIIVLDSLGMLSTDKEMADIAAGTDKRDMTRAQLIKGLFRVVTGTLAKLKVPMIVTNHVYDVVGAYVPTKTQGGGSGLKYAASTIVFLSASKEKEGDEVVGNILRCRVKKSRFTKQESVGKTLLNYKTGLNRYYGLLDLAVEAGVWKEEGSKVVTDDGSKHFAKKINNNPETYFTKPVLDKIDLFCKEKYCYGSAGASPEIDNTDEDDTEITTKPLKVGKKK